MEMKRSSIAGWKDIFTFTLKQTLKSRAFIISYIIFVVLALVSMPLINMFVSSQTQEKAVTNVVKKVYVNNETTLPDIDFTGLLKGDMSSIRFEKMQEDYDTVSKRIDSTEKDSVILTVSDNNGMFSLSFVKASKGPVSKKNLNQLGAATAEQFETFRINTLGITPDQVARLNAPVSTLVSMTDTNGVPIMKEDTSISHSEYWFIYGILFVILMVNTMASTQIATSIVTEKSTRVIEYLLISVRPLALMIGKIIAMLVAVLLQMGSMVAVLFISNAVTSAFNTGSQAGVAGQFLPSNIFANLNIVNIIFCFILMLLGLLFYATLAGLAGATVSKLEEIQEGLTLFTLVSIVGAYIGIGAANVMMASGENAYVIFALLFPLSSPFILPGALLVGKASLMFVIIASVLQVVFIILLFLFVAKVFETLILHNGNTIKPKELIKIFKTV
jgi:ABC-2 type transport system permease protein